VKRVLVVALVSLTALPASAGKTCVEQSDVVGDRVCGRYGLGWSAERTVPLTAAFGFFSTYVEPRGRSWSASTEKGAEGVGVSGAAMGMRSMQTFGFDFRFVGNLSQHAYLGLDTALAFAAIGSAVAPTGGWEFRDKKTLDFVHVRESLVLGGRVPLGRLSLRVETLVGFDIASAGVEMRKGQGEWQRGSVTSFMFLLEPRVAVDVWMTPWSTVSVWAGTNFLHPSDRATGISFAIHGRSFDGRLTL